jgi:hypothetical protein
MGTADIYNKGRLCAQRKAHPRHASMFTVQPGVTAFLPITGTP